MHTESEGKATTIKEVYEKYKHFDEVLSDKRWDTPVKGEVSGDYIEAKIQYDLWQAIVLSVKEGYDSDGYDSMGYDSMGFNREGYNRMGRNRGGYNREVK